MGQETGVSPPHAGRQIRIPAIMTPTIGHRVFIRGDRIGRRAIAPSRKRSRSPGQSSGHWRPRSAILGPLRSDRSDPGASSPAANHKPPPSVSPRSNRRGCPTPPTCTRFHPEREPSSSACHRPFPLVRVMPGSPWGAGQGCPPLAPRSIYARRQCRRHASAPAGSVGPLRRSRPSAS